ncbi:MAG: RNase adapter RapZ [Nannocystaceae bacterium]|nr:RNase adapter RapZ [Nannocystaceae bacterium]
MDLLVISGLSGGGKSTALHALEDLGVYCVDNVPLVLLPQLMESVRRTEDDRPVAVVVDARDTAYLERFAEIHQQLTDAGHAVDVLFFEAASDVLVRRYSETRRRHPMGDLPEAIDRERELLGPIREKSERPIDTSTLTGRQLRQLMRDRFGSGGTLRLVLTSFGFRNGVPSEADIVLDARFLDNPFEREDLRALSGLHEPVADYVLGQEDARTLLKHIEGLVRFVAPRSAAEGRSYLTVAVGCTGGQHRSVALVEALKQSLSAGEAFMEPAPRLVVRHRDVGGTAR